MPTVKLSSGTLEYVDSGQGRPIVFIHGALVTSSLWRKVIPTLSQHFRCIAPTLPLGAHRTPMNPDADLTPPGLARLIAEFIAALDLKDVVLVGSDTGGALCQLVLTRHPERLGGLVLTNCDAYTNFFPPLLRAFQVPPYLPGGMKALTQLWRLDAVQWLIYKLVAHNVPERALLRTFFAASTESADIRRDTAKFLRGIHNRHTLEAARHFSQVRIPVQIIWGRDDLFFPLRDAERLKVDLPNARLAIVERSRTFIAEDQPDAVSEHILRFAGVQQPAAELSSRR